MRCKDCGLEDDEGEVSDQWEVWEGIPLCAPCVGHRFDVAGGVPDHWRIDYD